MFTKPTRQLLLTALNVIMGQFLHPPRVERKLKVTQKQTKWETIVSMSALRILVLPGIPRLKIETDQS